MCAGVQHGDISVATHRAMLTSIVLAAQLGGTDPVAAASYAELRAELDAMKSRPEYNAYAEGFARSRSFPSSSALTSCARLAADRITVLVKLDADGRVQQVAADGDGAAADCYVAKLTGAQFKPPQFVPFVLSVVFGKLGQ